MIVDQLFHIPHNLSVSSLGDAGHLLHAGAMRLEDSRGLRVQDKGNS
jgi:hypothetical protein